MFCVEVTNSVYSFSNCVVRSLLYLDTNFVDILFRFPQCYFFLRRILFQKRIAYFKSVMKISKGFKKWNCFRKTGLNTSLMVSKVRTATSVTKIISRKYKFHVPKRKMLISFRGGGGTSVTFCWVCALASQSPYPIIVYSMANYRPHLMQM